MWLRETLVSIVARTRGSTRRVVARLWQCIYHIRFRINQFCSRYRYFLVLTAFSILAFLTIYVMPHLQISLETHYTTNDKVAQLQGLVLNTGTALIGAAAIVTSLVLFSMQVNIERMPHGLFRSLSTDRRLLGAFTVAFLLAITLATLSVAVDQDNLSLVVLAFVWVVISILGLFIYAYRRALFLTNPLRQLKILIDDTCKELRTWARRAHRAVALMDVEENTSVSEEVRESPQDLARRVFFDANGHWTDGAHRGVQHAVSFARTYAERGDYEVADAALTAIVNINYEYVKAKERTFYAHLPFVPHPLAEDAFINATLESLRKYLQHGITRRDEQHIDQTLQAIAALLQVYVNITYSTPPARRYHAHVAEEYLTSAIRAVVPLNMPDVLLAGQRLMGKCARLFLSHGTADEMVGLSEKMATIAATGCTNKDHQAVTMAGVEELGNLTLQLLGCKDPNIDFTIEKVTENVASIVRLSLAAPDTGVMSIHSTLLASYYSGTSVTSFKARVMKLVNEIIAAKPDDAYAQMVTGNIARWADNSYVTNKQLLLTAIQVQSRLYLT